METELFEYYWHLSLIQFMSEASRKKKKTTMTCFEVGVNLPM